MKRAAIATVCLLWALVGAGCAPLVMPAGPPQGPPAAVGGAVRSPDGAELPVQAWLPRQARPRAVLVAVHGFNDYGHFFAGAGRYLAARGIASYAYDQRGFGKAPNHGTWPGTAALVGDLRAVIAVMRERHRGVPMFVLGASMGGAVVMAAMTGPDPPQIDGIILAAPAVRGRATMPWPQTASLWLAAHTVPWLKVSGRGLGIKPSDNKKVLRALGRDPLVIKETRIDALYGLVNLMDAALAAARRLDGRLLILYGEHDQLVPERSVRQFFAELPASGRARRRVALYPRGYHMLLRDLQAETVWADIASWIADPARPLPSGADDHAAGTCRRWKLCDKLPLPAQAASARS